MLYFVGYLGYSSCNIYMLQPKISVCVLAQTTTKAAAAATALVLLGQYAVEQCMQTAVQPHLW